jgi:hypothetical protein
MSTATIPRILGWRVVHPSDDECLFRERSNDNRSLDDPPQHLDRGASLRNHGVRDWGFA